MERCGAKNRHGKPCGLVAGMGTDHRGTGRCKFHGGSSKGPGRGNGNAVKTGEHAHQVLTRWDGFQEACETAPVDHKAMRETQARRNHARITFMYEQLIKTEQELVDLAAAGDGTAFSALAVVEISRKQEPHTDPQTKETALADVELSTKSRSVLDRWLAQQAAIERAERTYGWIAEGLRPRDGQMGSGGIGTLIINNNMPGVDDGAGEDDGE